MSLIALSVLLILAAGIAAAVPWRRPAIGDALFRAGVAAGGLSGAAAAVHVLAGGSIPDVSFGAGTPGGPWVLGLDVLSALFLLTIVLVGTAAAIFGVTYLRRPAARSAGVAHLLVAVLIAALELVVMARAVVPFLVAWEVMALVSYALIVTDHADRGVRQAGMLYLVATHVGTLALFGAFAAWGGGSPDLTFAALGARALGPAVQAAVLGGALIGFGLKAGVVPMHFWLAEAHAAAPSHVSALMSGIVIKMGIYGLLRVTLLAHGAPAWWGWLLLALGAASGVLGVVWALVQHDLKRLLAFHSVENIGIIVCGIGAGSLGVAYQHPLVAVLGFGGAALHTMNHALFKGLLFLGAGSVAHATGTREIDRLGGLIRRLPGTMTVFLIGSVAIAGLPPLNGFVSEWLVFRSLLAAGLAPGAIRVAVLAVAALGLIGALAVACFAKVGSVVFLGTPRAPLARTAHESAPGMLWPMYGLAAACVVIGVVPSLAVAPALQVGALVTGVPWTAAGIPTGDPAAFAVGGLSVLVLVLVAAGLGARALMLRRRDRRQTATWRCGFPLVTPRMQYTGSSFAAPLAVAYGAVSGVRVERTPAALATHAMDPVLHGFVAPLWAGVEAAFARIHPLQRGRPAVYVLYVVAALVAALLYLVLAGPAS